MKFSLAFMPVACISAVYGQQFLERRAGNCGAGNNCQRGVGGTAGVKPPLSSRMADCSSLNVVTVSPSTVTTTMTTTVYESVVMAVTDLTPRYIPPSQPEKRQDAGATTITPTAVPAYATYCKSASAYYSACSCAGATPVTTTLATPTYTDTETVVTSTSSVCPAKRMVRRGLEKMGYEVDEHFDAIYYTGIRLI